MTDAELAILSLLSEGPSFDHDLNTALDSRGLRRWTAVGHSSMYYVLEKLEQQGLVELLSESYGHRLFGISSAGIGVLQTAVSDLLSTPHPHNRNFELGLANLHILKPSQIRTALLTRQQDLQVKLTRIIEERKNKEAPETGFQIDAIYDHVIAMIEAELKWLATFIEQWEAQAPPEPEVIIETNIIPRDRQVVLPQDSDSIHKETTREGPMTHLTNPTKPMNPPKPE
jgi:DNA-binding PadR family transcriptional regulator